MMAKRSLFSRPTSWCSLRGGITLSRSYGREIAAGDRPARIVLSTMACAVDSDYQARRSVPPVVLPIGIDIKGGTKLQWKAGRKRSN